MNMKYMNLVLMFLLVVSILGFGSGCVSAPPDDPINSQPSPESAGTPGETDPSSPSPTGYFNNEKVIFADNFNNRKNEWQQWRGNWGVNRQGLLVQNSADPRHLNSIMYVAHPQASDAVIEVRLRVRPNLPTVLIQGTADDKKRAQEVRTIIGAGIVFRMKDEENFYMFRLAGEEGAVLGKMVSNEWFDLDNPRTANLLPRPIKFAGSNWYHLKVEVSRSRIKCYINGGIVVDKVDDTFTIGRFGLCTFKTEADFDNFRVTEK